MPVGLVPALIMGGSAIAGGALSANASNNAAQTQAQAGNNALALQSQIYNTTRGDLSPYNLAGQGALGNLQRLLGLPSGATMAGRGPQPMSAGPTPGQINFLPGSIPSLPVGNSQNGAMLTNAYNTGATQLGLPTTLAGNPNGFVMMKAPDGSINRVDPAHVAWYEQKGAVRI